MSTPVLCIYFPIGNADLKKTIFKTFGVQNCKDWMWNTPIDINRLFGLLFERSTAVTESILVRVYEECWAYGEWIESVKWQKFNANIYCNFFMDSSSSVLSSSSAYSVYSHRVDNGGYVLGFAIVAAILCWLTRVPFNVYDLTHAYNIHSTLYHKRCETFLWSYRCSSLIQNRR